jgi:hypothetical protein
MQLTKNKRHAFTTNESREEYLDRITEALTHQAYSHLKLATRNFKVNTFGAKRVDGLTKK